MASPHLPNEFFGGARLDKIELIGEIHSHGRDDQPQKLNIESDDRSIRSCSLPTPNSAALTSSATRDSSTSTLQGEVRQRRNSDPAPNSHPTHENCTKEAHETESPGNIPCDSLASRDRSDHELHHSTVPQSPPSSSQAAAEQSLLQSRATPKSETDVGTMTVPHWKRGPRFPEPRVPRRYPYSSPPGGSRQKPYYRTSFYSRPRASSHMVSHGRQHPAQGAAYTRRNSTPQPHTSEVPVQPAVVPPPPAYGRPESWNRIPPGSVLSPWGYLASYENGVNHQRQFDFSTPPQPGDWHPAQSRAPLPPPHWSQPSLRPRDLPNADQLQIQEPRQGPQTSKLDPRRDVYIPVQRTRAEASTGLPQPKPMHDVSTMTGHSPETVGGENSASLHIESNSGGVSDQGMAVLSFPSPETVGSMANELHAVKANFDEALSTLQQIQQHQIDIDHHFQGIRRDLEGQVKSLQHMSSSFDRSARNADTPDAEFENLVFIASARSSKVAAVTSTMKGISQQYEKLSQALMVLLGQPSETMPAAGLGSRFTPESFLLTQILGTALSSCDDLARQFGLAEGYGQSVCQPEDAPEKKLDTDEASSKSAEDSLRTGEQQDTKTKEQLLKAGDHDTESYVEALKDVPVAPGEVAVMRLEEMSLAPQTQPWKQVKKKSKGKKN